MADFSAIRTKIKNRIITITDFANRTYDTWPDQVHMPCCIVMPVQWDYRQAMGNVNHGRFEITVLAAPLGEGLARGQAKLDAWLDDSGSSSIKTALEGDKTLEGTVATLHVPGFRDYGALTVNGLDYLGVKIDVEVWT